MSLKVKNLNINGQDAEFITLVSGDVNILNQADNEDLVNIDSVIKFKDKEYDPDSFSGLGRIYLRKNMLNGVNILSQEMLPSENTIYIIQYDYDLQGAEITIPEGCVLDFQGGKINNGILSGNNSNIIAELSQIFGLNVDFKGSWNINEVYPEWFGLVYNNPKYGTQNVQVFNKVIQLQVLGGKKICIGEGDVYIDAVIDEFSWGTIIPTIKLLTGTNMCFQKTRLLVNPNDYSRYNILCAVGVHDIRIQGGIIIGDVADHYNTEGEWGYGLHIAGSYNIEVIDMEFNECWGDGIMLGYDSTSSSTITGIDSDKHPRHIKINNVKCLRNRRQGISICDGIDVQVNNSVFSETGIIKATRPTAGMDLEPNGNWEYIKDIVCTNCIFNDNIGYNVTSWYNTGAGATDDNLISATFHNCDFTSADNQGQAAVLLSNTLFTNCQFDELWNGVSNDMEYGSYCAQDCTLRKVVFNGHPRYRVLQNCLFKDAGHSYIYWDSLEFDNVYLVDCTFMVNNASIVQLNWGGGIYGRNIKVIQPKIINLGDNPEYEMELHRIQVYRPIIIGCKIYLEGSQTPIITDDYDKIIARITGASSLSNGTVASIGRIPYFIHNGKWYDAMGHIPENKKGLHGERPMNLTESDAGYLFYDTSYSSWDYWSGSEWKRIKGLGFYADAGGGSTRPNSPELGALYFDTDINMPIWWAGTAWRDSTGAETGLQKKGTLEQRPDPSTQVVPVGYLYIQDNKPIWWTGSAWVDANGNDPDIVEESIDSSTN